MKKFLSAMPIVLACYCISCNSSGGGGGLSATAQKNLDAMHGVQKCFETKDFSKVGDFIAEDGINHSGENGDVKGLANLKADFVKMSAMTTDDKTVTVKEMADDEYVMAWNTYSGKMKVDGMGMKAGSDYSMSAIEVSKFKDGKAIEHWSFMDMATMMKMMAPPMPMPAPGDTSKMKKEEPKKM